jgi:hypothetical protein
MDGIFSSNRSKTALALLLAALLSVMVFSGCTSQDTHPQQNGNSTFEDKTSPSGQPQMNSTLNTSVVTDNKTSYEKNQTTIKNILADATYSQEFSYFIGDKTDIVEINITVADDTVTSAIVTPVSALPMSEKIIGNFNAALPDLVVGKKINEIKLPANVAGSSYTSAAFQQYVDILVQGNGGQPQ